MTIHASAIHCGGIEEIPAGSTVSIEADAQGLTINGLALSAEQMVKVTVVGASGGKPGGMAKLGRVTAGLATMGASELAYRKLSTKPKGASLVVEPAEGDPAIFDFGSDLSSAQAIAGLYLNAGVTGGSGHGGASLTVAGVNGQITVDGDWLTISRKGGLAKMTQGLKGDKRIPLPSVTSVQFKPATNLTNGYIQLALQGSHETKGGLLDATKDENSVMFKKSQNAEFEALRNRIEHYITARLGPSAPVVASAAPADVADQLMKLAQLREQGILSDEEFQQQKARLLS